MTSLLQVVVTDRSESSSVSDTVDITVQSNSAPVLGTIGNQSVDELVQLTFTATATDSDGDTLSYSLATSPPTGSAINNSTGIFTWTPTELQDGSHTFDVTVSDGITEAFSCTETSQFRSV